MDLPEFHRGRRLRRTAALRDMVREVRLCADDLIMPYFVVDTPDRGFRKPIDSMPGQFQLSLDELEKQVRAAVDTGMKSLLLFGIPAAKDPMGPEPMRRTALFRKPCACSRKTGPTLWSSPTCACANTPRTAIAA